MQHLILKGFVMIAALLSVAADDLSTGPMQLSFETPAIADDDASSRRGASSEELTDMAEDTGPANVALSSNVASFSKAASIEGPPSTVPSIGEESAGTSSVAVEVVLNPIRFANPPDDSEAEDSQPEVVVIAVCVSLLSLAVIGLSVAMTFLIRRRMRQKAYLRVKHASQTELAVHYVQNTPASAAARDLLMEQLFESLATMDASDSPTDFQMAYSSDDQCLTPTESIAPELVGGKNRICSRSMPSLKNLNAHEEALNCSFAFVSNDVSGKRKGRSRSFTEKTISGVVGADAAGRGKNALRSHSEKAKSRLAVVSRLTPGKRFEKKQDKTNRRSTPSFSRFARFNILRGQTSKRKAADAKEPRTECERTFAAEQTPLTQIASHSDAHIVVANNSDLVRAKCYSASLSDFELPNVSPILQDMKPMLTALQMNGCVRQTPKSTAETEDALVEHEIKIFRDVPLLNHHSTCATDKAASMEEISGEYLCRKGKASSRVAEALLSTSQTKTPQACRSVNDLDEIRMTVV